MLKAHFEINPKYIKESKRAYVVRQSKNTDITPQRIVYNVTYKEWNGQYYLNHVRGELDFSVKKKDRLFSRSTTVHTFFEIVVCKIDDQDVKLFSRKESFPVSNVFSETKFQYDPIFWGNFNFILPEQNLEEALERISAKIEEGVEKSITKLPLFKGSSFDIA